VSGSESERHALAEEELESRWETAPAVLVVIVFQLTLAGISWLRDWQLWGLPWWVWTIAVPFEAILLTSLAWDRARRALERIGRRRNVAMVLLGLISLANAFALVALLGSLIGGHEQSGGQLLLKATTIWGTNVVVFGLWFWAVDRGGPVRRLEPHPPLPDFQVPAAGRPTARETRLAPRALRLHLRLVHELDRIQPDRHRAADPPSEAADADGVRDLGRHRPARRRARRQHLQVGNAAGLG
jgi:hypothetical protein